MSDYEAEYQRERAEGYRNAALLETRRADIAEARHQLLREDLVDAIARAEAAEAELAECNAAHTSLQCWRTECIVNEGRIAKTLPILQRYEATHSYDWTCLGDAIDTLTGITGA